MNTFKVPATEIEKRRFRIQQELKKSGIDGLLTVQRTGLFYFTGTAQNGYLFLPAEGEPLLCIKRYLPRAREESFLRNIIEIRSIKEVPGRIIDACGRLPEVLGLEFDILPVREFNYFRALFPACKLVDGSEPLLNVRKIKSLWEIRQMERTAELSRKTFEYMQTVIRPGMTKMQFTGMYQTYARKLGHGGMLRTRHFQTEAYTRHAPNGKNGGNVGLFDSMLSGNGTSAAFPGSGSKPLAAHEPIPVNFGAVLNGYHVNETRMFAIGSMPDKARRACGTAIEIHNAVIEHVKPGITAGALFDHSVPVSESLGYADTDPESPGVKISLVGHGIGVELIEPPFIASGKSVRLEPGMTFAMTSKLCFENESAAEIKSVFLVTEKGARLISKVPAEIFLC